jgi:type II secretory pathway component PulF
LALARLASELARMVGAGVPFVEALRVLAPTFRGPVLGSLGRRVRDAAGAAERGEPLDAAFADRIWFDAEWRRLVAAGAAAGELAPMLERLADRQGRRARRQIDRLAAALEPAVTLALAAMVGVVVMAAVLPLIKLQEIVR